MLDSVFNGEATGSTSKGHLHGLRGLLQKRRSRAALFEEARPAIRTTSVPPPQRIDAPIPSGLPIASDARSWVSNEQASSSTDAIPSREGSLRGVCGSTSPHKLVRQISSSLLGGSTVCARQGSSSTTASIDSRMVNGEASSRDVLNASAPSSPTRMSFSLRAGRSRKSNRPATANPSGSSTPTRATLQRTLTSQSDQETRLMDEVEQKGSTISSREKASEQSSVPAVPILPVPVATPASTVPMTRASDVDSAAQPLIVQLGLMTVEQYARRSTESHFRLPAPGLGKGRDGLDEHGEAQFVNGYILVTPPPGRAVSRARAGEAVSQQRTPATPPRRRPKTAPASSRRPGTLGGGGASPHPLTQMSSITGSPLAASPSRPSPSRHGSFQNNAPPRPEAPWRLEEYFKVETSRQPGRFGMQQHKAHGYSPEVAPYPHGYGTETIVSETVLNLCYDNFVVDAVDWATPRAVLDLGCGVGLWTVDMARKWPHAEFVGLDLVPIQQSLAQESADLQRRLTWVVANVLDGLPFADGSFDLIHVRHLNFGIPQHKWPALLEEMQRVLTPNGRLELHEFDFHLMGNPRNMPIADVFNIFTGKASTTGGESERPLQSDVASWSKMDRVRRRNVALDALLNSTLQRRGINPEPSTFLPALTATLSGVVSVGGSDVRRVPILQNSFRKTFGQRIDGSTKDLRGLAEPDSPEIGYDTSNEDIPDTKDQPAASTSSEMDKRAQVERVSPSTPSHSSGLDALLALNYIEGADVFRINVPQDGQRPNITLQIPDVDAVRMAVMTCHNVWVTNLRHVLWQEVLHIRAEWQAKQRDVDDRRPSKGVGGHPLDMARSSEIAMSTLPLIFENGMVEPIAESRKDLGRGPPTTVLEGAVDRLWRDQGMFNFDLDRWSAEIRQSADLESLLRHKMRWAEAATRMDGWTTLEQVRKMRVRHETAKRNRGNSRAHPLFFNGVVDAKETEDEETAISLPALGSASEAGSRTSEIEEEQSECPPTPHTQAGIIPQIHDESTLPQASPSGLVVPPEQAVELALEVNPLQSDSLPMPPPVPWGKSGFDTSHLGVDLYPHLDDAVPQFGRRTSVSTMSSHGPQEEKADVTKSGSDVGAPAAEPSLQTTPVLCIRTLTFLEMQRCAA